MPREHATRTAPSRKHRTRQTSRRPSNSYKTAKQQTNSRTLSRHGQVKRITTTQRSTRHASQVVVPAHQEAAAEAPFTVAHGLVYFSYAVGVCCAMIFGFDLATGLLFRRASPSFDAIFSACGAALVWLAYDAHKVAGK